MPAKKKAKKSTKTKKTVKASKKVTAKKVMKAVKKTKPAKKTTQATAKTKPFVKKMTAVPEGYNTITPYLIVDHAMNAIEFYKKAFGAKVVMCMQKNGGKVGHAELQIGDSKIMLADKQSDCGACHTHAAHSASVSIHLYIKAVDTVVARAVAAGAMLLRPVENMFYGDRSSELQDPFGHVWYVSTHVEDVTPAEMKRRISKLCETHATMS